MTPQQLESALRDLPRFGKLVKDYVYRKVWRVEVEGEAFYLKFYPDEPNRWKKRVRGSLAMREMLRLQWLQKAQVPSPRAHSVLMGLTIDGQKGDAVVLEAIEPSVSLQDLAQESHLSGQPIPNHRDLVRQVIELLQRMGRAGLGHSDLHLGNFLVKEGRVYLIDAYPLHKRGMLLKQVMALAASAADVATRADLQRGWNTLGPGGPLPRKNLAIAKVWRKLMSRIWDENRYFAKIQGEDGWQGVAMKRFPRPRRWSRVSRMEFETRHWEEVWKQLKGMLDSEQLTVLKHSRSGDVLEGQIVVGGWPIEVIVKRPRRKYWYRYLNEFGRGGRAYRAWWKSWRNIFRGIPTAFPLLLMEKKTLGYDTDAVIVFEKVKGPTLMSVDLDRLSADDRQSLFHRVGALLRRLESVGLYHWDAKASNWMIRLDDPTGPVPLLIDVDGVRNNWGVGEGMRRLLLSMRQHPQYRPADSLALCRGYAPGALMAGDQ